VIDMRDASQLALGQTDMGCAVLGWAALGASETGAFAGRMDVTDTATGLVFPPSCRDAGAGGDNWIAKM
jgi:hypothetical protein